VRELLVQGEPLPAEFTRPEIAELLRAAQPGQAAAAPDVVPAAPSTASGGAAPPD
jgi:ATP sulfurylase